MMSPTSRLLIVSVVLSAATACAFDQIEQEPIKYSTTPATDPVARLQARIAKGEVKLGVDEKHGYLRGLLKELQIPEASQMLVFSRTSLQRNKISPRTPRALYFNDDVYVGWLQNSEIMELTAIDPQLGSVFYTVKPGADAPVITRVNDNCLQCHAGPMTQYVPGLLVRSVYPDPTGNPVLSVGTFRTYQTSAFKERWGGWYATGTHGAQRHMGNAILRDEDKPETLNRDYGANVTDLSQRFDVEPYLTPHSDLIALLVLEHQAQMHNLITALNYGTRLALRDEAIMNKALNRGDNFRSDSTMSRIKSHAEPLLQYLLFSEEALFTEPVAGTTDYAQQFQALGPKDKHGRSLRELDLTRRVFKYPCSYLIYSEQFDALPALAKEYVYQRLWDILNGKDSSKEFAHLTAAERVAIREILLETKIGLPAYWKK